MKLSERMRDDNKQNIKMIERIIKDKEIKENIIIFSSNIINKLIPEVEKLESEKQELIDKYIENTKTLLRLQKIKQYDELGRWMKSFDFDDDIKLLERLTGKSWEEICKE